MGDHPVGTDPPTLDDIGAKRRRHGLDLRLGKGAITMFMPGIDDLDADRGGIHVPLALPAADAGMPGPPRLGHQLQHAPVLEDEIVAGHLRQRVAQLLQRERERRILHAGIMQNQTVGQATILPLAVVGRRMDLEGDRTVGRGGGHGDDRRPQKSVA